MFLDFDIDIDYGLRCWDNVEIYDGSTIHRFCGPWVSGNYYDGDSTAQLSFPGPFTSSGTSITFKFNTNRAEAASGFLAVVCCSVTVTTDLTAGEIRIIYIT